jgi:hypothetical protein
MALSREEFAMVGTQLLTLGALVREMPLGDFIRQCEHSDAFGPLFAPSHWIAGKDKLDMMKRLAEGLRHFQVAIPTREEAEKLDREADERAERLGVDR